MVIAHDLKHLNIHIFDPPMRDGPYPVSRQLLGGSKGAGLPINHVYLTHPSTVPVTRPYAAE
jgi:hypothetical protein